MNKSKKSIQILVVDDSSELRSLYRAILSAKGMQVSTAENGREALEIFKQQGHDLILTDIVMPVADGFELIDWLKKCSPSPRIIAMSSFEPYLKLAKTHGAAAVFHKPFSPDLLIDVIKDLSIQPPKPLLSDPQQEDNIMRQAIKRLNLNEDTHVQVLDDYCAEVADYFQCDQVLVSIISKDHQTWVSGASMSKICENGKRSSDRSTSFCTHVVEARAALLVQDAANNPLFEDNHFVRRYGVRFYAGVPLITRRGVSIGTFCVMHNQPKKFLYYDMELLAKLSHKVLAIIELREKQKYREIHEAAAKYLSSVDAESNVFNRSSFEDLAVIEGCRSIEHNDRAVALLITSRSEHFSEVLKKLKRFRKRSMIGRLDKDLLGCIVPNDLVKNCEQELRSLLNTVEVVEGLQLNTFAGNIRAAFNKFEAEFRFRQGF